MTSAEISRLLDDICGDNDYVFAFQTTQEVRDLVIEIKRLVALTNIADMEWQSTDLEPLLGCLTAFIGALDISISREKHLFMKIKIIFPTNPVVVNREMMMVQGLVLKIFNQTMITHIFRI